MSSRPAGELPIRARNWVESTLAVSVLAASPISGSSTAAIHSLRTKVGDFVLKRFVYPAFLEEEPDRAFHEAAGMEAASAAGVPAPTAVAVDSTGDLCDVPAVLMSKLSGRSRLEVPDPRAIAHVEHLIHSVDVDLPWTFRRYNEGLELTPPPWAGSPTVWERAFQIVVSEPPVAGTGFIHRDFHPDNLLWSGSGLTGVVDWLSACRGPRAVDTAHCLVNLELRGDHDGSVGFLRECRRLSVDYHPHWVLVDAIDILPYYSGLESVARWPGRGWPQGARERLEALLERSLAELGTTSVG